MQTVDLSDTQYDGGLSPLTRYGTLNVSTARIPRKKRSRGNIAPARVTSKGMAPTDEGRELASQGIASVKVTYADGTSETRTASSFRKGRDRTSRIPRTAPALKQSDCQRFADIIGSIGDQNH